MIRKIRLDSGNKNNTFNSYGSNNVSFGGQKMKYGFPRQDWDNFRPQPMSREEEPPMIKYGYPQAPFEPDETNDNNNTEKPDISGEKSRFKYAIPQPFVDSEESDEDFIEELNKDFFGDEQEPSNAEAPKQKTSYFKRLWFAIFGKDAQ